MRQGFASISLTIGKLAGEIGVNKSNVLALFGSKQELQLATLAATRGILIEQVIASEEGLARLVALGEAWCDYLALNVFAGGCFLCAASTEMDGRPGPVRDAVAETMREWLSVLSENIEAATGGPCRDRARAGRLAGRACATSGRRGRGGRGALS